MAEDKWFLKIKVNIKYLNNLYLLRDNFKIIRCMDMVHLLTQMAVHMKLEFKLGKFWKE